MTPDTLDSRPSVDMRLDFRARTQQDELMGFLNKVLNKVQAEDDCEERKLEDKGFIYF
jgi:hypothetical protein